MDICVQAVLDIINRQLSQDISLEYLAAQVILSPYRLSHLFSQFVGVPCKKYITWCCMNRATELLRNDQLTVKEISQRIGWNDQNYFNRYFKQRFGITPRHCCTKPCSPQYPQMI